MINNICKINLRNKKDFIFILEYSHLEARIVILLLMLLGSPLLGLSLCSCICTLQLKPALNINTNLHITPTGIHIPRIRARLGPDVGWIIEPPFTETVELCTGIPAIDPPVESTLFKLLNCEVA